MAASKRLTEVEKRIRALPDDVRDLVEERAAILLENDPDLGDDEANRRALEMEAGQVLAPIAAAKPRAASPSKKKTTA